MTLKTRAVSLIGGIALACALLPGAALAQSQSPQLAPADPAFLRYQAKMSRMRAQGLPASGLVPAGGHARGLMPVPFALPALRSPAAASAFAAAQALKPMGSGTGCTASSAACDLRASGLVSPVQDEGPCEDSWAYATFGALESTLLAAGQGQSCHGAACVFSSNNLNDAMSRNPDPAQNWDMGWCQPGYARMSMAYLARRSGPMLQSQDAACANDNISRSGGAHQGAPVVYSSNDSSTDCPAQRYLQEALLLPDRPGPATPSNMPAMNAAIKQALASYGGVYTTINAAAGIGATCLGGGSCDCGAPGTATFYGGFSCDKTDAYFNATRSSFYVPADPHATDLAVTIVGWNDDYPAANFSQTPPGNGAFIVKNSWSTNWGTTACEADGSASADCGYFYMSYYSTGTNYPSNLSNSAVFNLTSPAASPAAAGHVYSYDPLGETWAMGFSSTTAWMANVFQSNAVAGTTEAVTQVGFYTNDASAAYQIYIYAGPGAGLPRSGTLVSSQSGTITSGAGYHAVTLSTHPVIASGQKFSIVVKLTDTGNSFQDPEFGIGYQYPIPIQYPVPNFTGQAAASAGHSYVSADGSTWNDLTSLGAQFAGYAKSSVCLHAMTDRGGSLPGPVSGLQPAVMGVSSVTWSWTAASNATSYLVTNGDGSQVLAPSVSATQWTQSGLSADSLAQVRVAGVRLGIVGPFTVSPSTYTYPAAPGAPALAQAFVSSMSATWTACAAGTCSGYELAASTAADFSGTVYSSATWSPAQNQLAVAGLVSSTSYYLKLAGLNGSGGAAWGPAAGPFLTSASPPAALPSGDFVMVSSYSMSVAWSANGNPLGRTTYTVALTTGPVYPNSDSGNVSFSTCPAGAVPAATAAGPLLPFTSYFLFVSAQNAQSVATGYSALGSTYTLASPPAARDSGGFVMVSSYSMSVAWSANGNPLGQTTYTVVLTTGPVYPNSDAGNVSLSTCPAGASPTTTTAGSLLPETPYYLFVRAKSMQGTFTGYTALGSTYTLASPPGALNSGAFIMISSYSMNVAWYANGNPLGHTTYTVVLTTGPVYPNSDAGNVSISTCPASAPPKAYAVGPLSPKTLYYLFVRARSMQGPFTDYTALGSTYTLASPPAALPSGDFVMVSSYSMSVVWSANGNPLGQTTYTVVLTSGPVYPNGFAGNVSFSTCPADAIPTATADGPLLPDLRYYLFVRADNLQGVQSAYAALGSTYTLASPPAALDSGGFVMVSSYSMSVAWSPNGNPLGMTTYTVVLTSGPAYPNSDAGNVSFSTCPAGASPTATAAGTLYPDTAYYLFVKAKSVQGDYTDYTALGSTFTWASPPAALGSGDFVMVSSYSISMAWSANGNPLGQTTYTVVLTTGPVYPNGDAGNISFSTCPAGDIPTAAATGPFLPNTAYYLFVEAQNPDGVYTDYAALGSTYTWAGPPTPAASGSFVMVSSYSLSVAWSPNGNPLGQTTYTVVLTTGPAYPNGDAGNVVLSTCPAGALPEATAAGPLSPDTAYYLFLRAKSLEGVYTDYAALGSTFTLAAPPSLPVQPFSAPRTDGFTFSFNGNNPAGTQYLAQVSTSPGLVPIAATYLTTATTVAVAGLRSNQYYYAEVAALNHAGVPTGFAATDIGTATLVAMPAAAAVPFPASGEATGQMTLHWSPGTLAAGTTYLAQISSSPAFAFVSASTTTAKAWAAFTTGILPNTTYYGQVQALGNWGQPSGPWLSPAGTGSSLALPATGAAIAAVQLTSMTVSWIPLSPSPSSMTCEGYRLDVSAAADFSSSVISRAVTAGVSSATVGGLSYGTRYYARVGTFNWQGAVTEVLAGSAFTASVPAMTGATTDAGLTLTLWDPFLLAPQVGSAQLVLPPAAFPAGTSISMTADACEAGWPDLGQAQSPEGTISALAPCSAMEIHAGADLAQSLQPAAPVTFVLAYDPTLAAGRPESSLHLFGYAPATSQWTFIPSQADASAHVLTATLPHFSYYAPFFVSASTAADLSGVQVWPQPWEVGAAGPYGAAALQFASLVGGTRVRIFTVTGELVTEGTASDGTFSWDGSNRFGRKAASGTYLAVFEANGQKKVRRVVIIR